jgi:hypothetical protein
LNVRVGGLEEERNYEAPGFPLALEVEQFALEATLFVWRKAVRRCRVVGIPNELRSMSP